MTKREPYYQVTDGEWVPITKRSHRSMCCHCHLVHIIDYRVDKNGQIEVRYKIDNRATAASRRSGNFPKK